MNESKYTASVNKLLDSRVYYMKLNQRYIAGVPDCYYSSRYDLWAEWKLLKSVPKVLDLVGGKDPTVTRLQQDWLVGRHKEGRKVAVIVGSPIGVVILPGLSWQRKMPKEEFESRAMSKREMAVFISEQMCGVLNVVENSPGDLHPR